MDKYVSFGSGKDFSNLRESKIANEYNVDEIEIKIVNRDGAKWIKDVKKLSNEKIDEGLEMITKLIIEPIIVYYSKLMHI